MNPTKIFILVVAGIASIITIAFIKSNTKDTSSDIMIAVQQGDFVIEVMTSGTLEAKNAVPILGPSGLRNHGIWQITIQNIIEEGTEIQKGQYVAQLDPSELKDKIADVQLQFDKEQSEYTQTRLDTALSMRESRDKLVDLDYTVKEKQLVLDQSQYEPPATIQRAEIELEKAKRALTQARENYIIKQEQSVAKMKQAWAELSKVEIKLNSMNSLLVQLQIVAPEDGMLIYKRDWDGKPIKAGSQVRAWEPTVATLPDLSKMISITYINEVDIRKIAKGQEVEIGFDAFPEKKLKGKVIHVANVGEQRPNADAKVFKVEVEVFGTDPLLKPGMTTSNKIVTQSIPQALFVPLESLHSQDDSITYVFKKDGRSTIKQEVVIGEANAEYIRILKGLTPDNEVSLSEIKSLAREEVSLLPELNGKRNKEETTPILTSNTSSN